VENYQKLKDLGIGCYDCYFFREGMPGFVVISDKDNMIGQCLRSPPIAVDGDDQQNQAVFPITRAEDVCGEWREEERA